MKNYGFQIVTSFLFAFCAFVASINTVSAAPQVEIKNSPYNFAVSNYSLTDKKTSSIGFVVSDVNDSLNDLRGKKGVILFILALCLATLCYIFRFKPAAITFTGLAGLIMLVNRPALFFFIAIPIYVIRLRMMDENNDRSHILGIFTAFSSNFSSKKENKDDSSEKREYVDKLTNDTAFDKGKSPSIPAKLSRPI